MSNITEVQVGWDVDNETWTIMTMDLSRCLFYGTAWDVDKWLEDHSDEYIEV